MSDHDDTFEPGNPSADEDTKYRFFPAVRRGYPPDAYYDAESERYDLETGNGGEHLETTGSLRVNFTAVGSGGVGGRQDRHGSKSIQLYGPEHVTGIDGRQVVRMEPEPGTSNYPPNYFATVEFDAPDLPWLFSPVSDDTLDESVSSPTGKGFPWCCLVVVEKNEDTVVSPAGSDKPLPSLEVPPRELPPLDEAWAWAHAQLVGSPTQKDGQSMSEAFREESTLTRSRLVSPRNLRNNTNYVAAVVPTFEAGVRAGLGEAQPIGGGQGQGQREEEGSPESGTTDDGSTTGETPGEAGEGGDADESTPMSLAWSVAETNVGDDTSDEPIELPLLHHWEFSTGEKGDFEYLVRELEPRNLNVDAYDIGSRTVDVSDPGPSPLEVWGDGATVDHRTVEMGGALRKTGSEPVTADDYVKDETLRTLLNRPGDVEGVADGEYEAVGPPIYGDRHGQVESLESPVGEGHLWLRDLNLNPGNRLAGAVGAEVVRNNQQQLMDQAWEQVGEIRAVNRRLAAAGLSREATETAMADLADAPEGWLATFTGPMHDRLLDGDRTVGARLDDSTLPRGLLSAPMRRLLSGSGRLSGRVETDVELGDVVADVAAGELEVATQSTGPAGMGTAARGVDLAELCEKLPDRPDTPGEEKPPWADRPEPVAELLSKLASLEAALEALIGLLSALVTEMAERDSDEYREEGSKVPDLVARIEEKWETVKTVAANVGKPMQNVAAAEGDVDLPGVASEFTTKRAGELHERLVAVASGRLLEDESEGESLSSDDVIEAREDVFRVLSVYTEIVSYLEADGDATAEGYLNGLVCDSVPDGVSRPEPDLATATGLDPVGHLVDRVGSRLGGIDLHAAHRSDPFDRVMAYPEFPKPMYDDLKDISEEYLLPGVAEIPRNTVGALETNPQFIESFLVGMNHEMASELLWRRYPTDRRGSYFRQFWDPSARVPKPDDEELLKDITEIHTWDDKTPDATSTLGSNVMTGAGSDGNADAGRGSEPNSQVVVVVRGDLLQRYPTTTIYATKAKLTEQKDGSERVRVPEWPTPNRTDQSVDTTFHRFPIFRGGLDPDVTFLGFDLTAEEATGETPTASVGEPRPDDEDHWVNDDGTDDLGWFFVLAEPPGEVRFGLDANQDDAGTYPPGITDGSGETHTTSNPDENPERGWSALSWGHLVESASELETKQNVSVYRDRPGSEEWKTEPGSVWETENDSVLTAEEAAVWGKNSAHMAYLSWQRPVRIAIHADDLLPMDGDDGGTEGI